MTSLGDKAILSGADNRPPMLEKDMYDSWKSRMKLYILNKQHGRMILESVENGSLLWPTVKENEVTRPKKYSELSATEAIQADCDVKATNIILQGLPPEVYALYASQAQSSIPLSITYPSNDFQSSVNHNIYNPSSSIPKVEYAPSVHQQSEFSQPDIGLVVPVFQKGKQRVIVCYNCKGEGHMSKQCTKPKRKRDEAWFKDKSNIMNQSETEFTSDSNIIPYSHVIQKTVAIVIRDSEETLMLEDESRSKMLQKQKDPMMSENKVNTKPVGYAALNQLSKDFETRFVPQIELSAEQAFWSQNSRDSEEPNLSISTTIVEVPKELPKVSMQYGHVVDAFIPGRRSKKGKRFGFVRFIRVLGVDRLNGDPVFKNKDVNINSGHRADQTSYVHAVTGKAKSTDDCEPVMVLDEACLNHKEYSLELLGKVKEFSILANVKVVLGSEGFSEIELNYMGGKGYWVRAKETTGWFSEFDEQNEDNSDSEDEQSVGTIKEDFGGSDGEMEGENNVSVVPDTVREKENVQVEIEESLQYPPGFTPCDVKAAGLDKNTMGINESSGVGGKKLDSVSVGSSNCKKVDIKRTGGSLLTVMEELIKVETKMESITLFDVKCCWGNFAFDHVYSHAVGNSGGILCVWEKSSFKKTNSTVSDYFVMIRGTWVCSGVNLLIISMYAPQEFSEKKMLWDYLGEVITKWNGEVIDMGDFNEIRYKNERYGSVFHAHGADAFNSFISNANLQEIPLGGCAFT
nr:RNA-directed DNA polymerase, eukaryota [Tanacetum cinerariifolium]